MKKLEFIEALNKRLPVELHPKTFALFVGRAYNQIMYDTFRKKLTGMDLFTKMYRNVTVSFDSVTKTYYSTLPVQIIQLPNPGDGIMSIHSMEGRGIEFAPKTSSMRDIHVGLEVNVLSGPIPYWILDGRVEYETRAGISTIDKVRMQVIPQFGELDMMDEIHIPSGKDEALMELVVQFATGSPPEKEINDQNNKTR